MENGSPLPQDNWDGLPDQENRPAVVRYNVTNAASTPGARQKNAIGGATSEFSIDVPPQCPGETGKIRSAHLNQDQKHEGLSSSADKEGKVACLRKTYNGKSDLKDLPVFLKKQADRLKTPRAVSSPRASEATSGIPRPKIPNANGKASGSTSKSIQKVKNGLESSLDPIAASNSPLVRNPPDGVRSSHSNFTIPQPFTLSIDKRASLGGQSSEVHPFGRSRSFQASRKDENKHLNDKVGSPRLVNNLSTEDGQASMQLRASANSSNSFNFNSDVRAERRREFNSKLEERLTAKEVASKQAQAKTKEEIDAEIKEFRKSLSFKAAPMPAFYHDPTPPKLEIKKIPPTRPKSPKLGRKDNSTGPSYNVKLEGLEGALDGEERALANDCPSDFKNKKTHASAPVLKGLAMKGTVPTGKKSSKLIEDEDDSLAEQHLTKHEQFVNGKVCEGASSANVDVAMPQELTESSHTVVEVIAGEQVSSFPTANGSKELNRTKSVGNSSSDTISTINVVKPKSASKVSLRNSLSKIVAHPEAKEQRAVSGTKKQANTSNGGSLKYVQTGKAAIKHASTGSQERPPSPSVIANVIVAS